MRYGLIPHIEQIAFRLLKVKYYKHPNFMHKQIFCTVQSGDHIFIVMYGDVPTFRHVCVVIKSVY